MANPVLADRFESFASERSNVMTVGGTVAKTLFLFAVLSLGFGWTWGITTQNYTAAFSEVAQHHRVDSNGKQLADQIDLPPAVYGHCLIGVLGGFVVAMIIIFNPPVSPFLGPAYAFLEGMALGAISAGFEAKYPGIALQAAGATFGTLIGMLMLYSTGIVRVTPGFMKGLLAAMFGILVIYMIDIVMGFFGTYVSVVHDRSWASIGLSGFIVAIAAFNLVVDFDTVEQGVGRAPKYMEWYAGFGLMVTLVWLYLEILRLLAKLKGDD